MDGVLRPSDFNEAASKLRIRFRHLDERLKFFLRRGVGQTGREENFPETKHAHVFTVVFMLRRFGGSDRKPTVFPF